MNNHCIYIFKVSMYTHQDSSQGAEFFGSQKIADARLDEFKAQSGDDFDDARSSVEQIEVKLGKKHIIALLNKYAGHPDNG